MRREGYEFQVSKPEVILKEIDGKLHEPYEQVEIEVSGDFQGVVMEMLGQRRGQLLDMKYATTAASIWSTGSDAWPARLPAAVPDRHARRRAS